MDKRIAERKAWLEFENVGYGAIKEYSRQIKQ